MPPPQSFTLKQTIEHLVLKKEELEFLIQIHQFLYNCLLEEVVERNDHEFKNSTWSN